MALVRPNALLIDITRCVGCNACVGACLEAHGLGTAADADAVKGLSARALTVVEQHGDLYVRKMCRHCVTPSCASVCPVEALKKTPAGPVVYEASRCLGCRYCLQACPFGIPAYEWGETVPSVVKCDFCATRQAQGEPTACSQACEFEATMFGPRDEMLAEAHRRIAENPDGYYPRVYGEEEIGGTSMLFLSPVPFEQLGFPALGSEPMPALTGAALEKIPGILSIGGALLAGIWWITKRREEVARAESGTLAAQPEENDHDRA